MGMQVLSSQEFLSAYPELISRVPESLLGETVHIYDEDVVLDGELNLDLDRADGTRGALVYLGNLTVHGTIRNFTGEYGLALIVEKELRAHNLVCGGAFIALNRVIVDGLILGHYNDGKMSGQDAKAMLKITTDHNTSFRIENYDLQFECCEVMWNIHIDKKRVYEFPDGESDLDQVEAFIIGPLAKFFKNTKWYEFNSYEKRKWTCFTGVVPAERPDLDPEGISILWDYWAMHVLENEAGPIPQSFKDLINLVRTHLVAGMDEGVAV